MGKTVKAFNAITGHNLSERDGWMFMVQLKAVRACTTPTGQPDDYQDGVAYFGLAGESVSTLHGEITVTKSYDRALPDKAFSHYGKIT